MAELSKEDLETIGKTMVAVKQLDGVTMDLCGSWLWVGGNTKTHKEALKALGFRWASKKKLWYFHTGKYFRKGARHISKEEIDKKYGCKQLIK